VYRRVPVFGSVFVKWTANPEPPTGINFYYSAFDMPSWCRGTWSITVFQLQLLYCPCCKIDTSSSEPNWNIYFESVQTFVRNLNFEKKKIIRSVAMFNRKTFDVQYIEPFVMQYSTKVTIIIWRLMYNWNIISRTCSCLLGNTFMEETSMTYVQNMNCK
jgi:hypothetical protein